MGVGGSIGSKKSKNNPSARPIAGSSVKTRSALVPKELGGSLVRKRLIAPNEPLEVFFGPLHGISEDEISAEEITEELENGVIEPPHEDTEEAGG